MYYYSIPRCEDNSVGEYLELTGTVEHQTDSQFYDKKRLMISNKRIYAPDKYSFKYWNSLLVQARSFIWDKLSAPIYSLLPYPHSALLISMVFGGTDALDDQTSQLFIQTGTTHIQAVSGYNFAVITAGVYQATKRHARKKVQGLSILLVTIPFTIVVGAQPSVIRAALTVIAILTTKFLLIRQYNARFYLGIVLLLMILCIPSWLFSISFQLSGAATAGILYLYPFIQTHLDLSQSPIFADAFRYTWIKNISTEVGSAFSIALAATIATLPLLIFHFNNVTLIGLLVSSLCSYLLSYIVVVGFWTSIISIGSFTVLTSKVLQVWMILFLYVPIEMYLCILKAAATVKFLTFTIHTFTLTHVLLSYCFIFGLMLFFNYKHGSETVEQLRFV
jgi:ComEC/Rec2-related protein